MSKRAEKMQKEVLAALRRNHGPLSACDVPGELRDACPKIAPPPVYRALAVLIQSGRVHRLESLNGFMVCQSERHQQASILSICDDGGVVEEKVARNLLEELSSISSRSGFVPLRHIIEVHIPCASCDSGKLRP